MATTTLPNPTTQPVAVRAADISTMNFFIDRVSNLSVSTLFSKVATTSTATFTTMGAVASSSAVTTNGTALVLTSAAGVYTSAGMAYVTPVAPSTVVAWDTVTVVASTTANTSVKAYIYTGTSTFTLIPNSDLPSNNNGFTGSSIDISRLDPVIYPNVTVQLRLTTASSTVTPTVSSVKVGYVSSKTPAPNITFGLRGVKTIGTLADSSLVYKYNTSKTTSGAGLVSVNNLEWDAYTLTPVGYDVAEACPSNPLSLAPAASSTVELVLAPITTTSYRLITQTVSGVVIPGATVTISRPGYNDTALTSSCGQVFFSGLTAASDYSVDVAASGYTTQSFSNVTASGTVVQTVTF